MAFTELHTGSRVFRCLEGSGQPPPLTEQRAVLSCLIWAKEILTKDCYHQAASQILSEELDGEENILK